MTKLTISHEDDNQDGINDYVAVYSDDFGKEPLLGDYRGIELCRIRYIPSCPESIIRAENIARSVVAAQQSVQPTAPRIKAGDDFSYMLSQQVKK